MADQKLKLLLEKTELLKLKGPRRGPEFKVQEGGGHTVRESQRDWGDNLPVAL